jgi:hypothetical protein
LRRPSKQRHTAFMLVSGAELRQKSNISLKRPYVIRSADSAV